MRVREAGQPRREVEPLKRFGGIAVNFLGIMCAFAAALGGLFLVQGRLGMEQEQLLSGGGLVDLPQADSVETAEMESAFISSLLTEEELLELAGNLEGQEEAMPHEPLPGQLTMTQAIDHGKIWLEEFFLPYFGAETSPAGEYRTSCYLWAPESAGQKLEDSPWLSCWTISLSSQEINASLTINAKSAQVLEASVSFAAPAPQQSEETLLAMLGAYADSFGAEEDYCLMIHKEKEPGAKGFPYYQSIGTRGLYAAIQADSILVSIAADAASDTAVYMERFYVHLNICTAPEQYLQD